jgi:hypothetical protein
MLLSNQVSDRSSKFGCIGGRKPEAFAIAAEQYRKARMRQMGKSRSEFFAASASRSGVTLCTAPNVVMTFGALKAS